MKKTTLTEKKAEQTPTGGVLVGKRKGQTIIHDEGSLSGYLVGKTHAEGGIKAVNKATGQPLEMQGGEVVITAPAVSDQTKNEFNGKMMTNREILSQINVNGGGVAFAKDGMEIPKKLNRTGATYSYGGKTMTDHEIYKHITGGHLSKGKSLPTIAKMHDVSMEHIMKQVKLGLKVESEHTGNKKEQMRIVKDHLVENPNYYTILKKVGLKKGGSLVKDAKSGNTPARDLNNYNDVVDVQSDGKVGGNSGIDMDGTGGADASAGVGAFKDGGELDFLNDVERIFDEGGSTDLPVVDYLTVYNASSSISNLEGRRYNNYFEFKEDIEQVYKNIGRKVRTYAGFKVYDKNDNVLLIVSTAISDQKNTIKNFNPLTGNYENLKKVFQNERPVSFKKYNWDEWFSFKRSSPTKQEPKSESSSKGSESKGKIIDLSQTKIWVGDDLKLSEAVQKKAFELGWHWESNPKKEVHKDGQRAIFFFNDKSILSGDEDTFKSVTLKEIFASDLLGSAPSSTSGNQSGKFSSGEIDAFNQIDKIVKDFEIEFVDGMSWENGGAKDFDIVNTLTGEVYRLRKYNKSLGVQAGDADMDKSRKLIADFNEWKKSNPTSASESKEESKQEEQSIRNFELEKKYLTQRINALSSELDLKRPILSNEEIAFYQREINKFVSKLRVVSNDEMELKPIQARVNGVYKVKWGDYTKQYPETDTLSINGVKSELTFEEFLTVRTPEFKSFFGNWEQAYFDNTYSGVSKIINQKTKEPMPVFHGTNVLFTEWKTYETNNAHYFAVKREMSDFFATSWETRSDKAGVDSKAIKALNPNTGTFLYRCFLDIRNPIDFSKFGVEKRPIKEFLLFLKINYNIGDYDFWTNLGNARGFTSETRVYAWQIIRLWQNFTKYVKNFTTYDGYIFYEYIPDTPYGGLENASLSFCAFESNQIKFADAYEFNALSNDSRFDFGGTL